MNVNFIIIWNVWRQNNYYNYDIVMFFLPQPSPKLKISKQKQVFVMETCGNNSEHPTANSTNAASLEHGHTTVEVIAYKQHPFGASNNGAANEDDKTGS